MHNYAHKFTLRLKHHVLDQLYGRLITIYTQSKSSNMTPFVNRPICTATNNLKNNDAQLMICVLQHIEVWF